MKQATTGTISGCLVWLIAFGVLGMCVLPIAMAVGAFTSKSDFAIQQTSVIVCPDATTPKIRTYATTSTDRFGSRTPATAYVLQCLDTNGKVVKEDPIGFAFIWIGFVTAVGLLLVGVLAFVFAAPAGVLIATLIQKWKKV